MIDKAAQPLAAFARSGAMPQAASDRFNILSPPPIRDRRLVALSEPNLPADQSACDIDFLKRRWDERPSVTAAAYLFSGSDTPEVDRANFTESDAKIYPVACTSTMPRLPPRAPDSFTLTDVHTRGQQSLRKQSVSSHSPEQT